MIPKAEAPYLTALSAPVSLGGSEPLEFKLLGGGLAGGRKDVSLGGSEPLEFKGSTCIHNDGPMLGGSTTLAIYDDRVGITNRDNEHFRKAYVQPALAAGLIEMTRPDRPRSRLQRYRLTAAGDKRKSHGQTHGKRP